MTTPDDLKDIYDWCKDCEDTECSYLYQNEHCCQCDQIDPDEFCSECHTDYISTKADMEKEEYEDRMLMQELDN
jgi:hypothetical protein